LGHSLILISRSLPYMVMCKRVYCHLVLFGMLHCCSDDSERSTPAVATLPLWRCTVHTVCHHIADTGRPAESRQRGRTTCSWSLQGRRTVDQGPSTGTQYTYSHGRIKASVSPGAVAKIRALNKLLKDAVCISLRKTEFISISLASFLLDFTSSRCTNNFPLPADYMPKNCGLEYCSAAALIQ